MCSGFHLNHVEGASLGSTRIRSFGVFFTWKMGKTDRGTIGQLLDITQMVMWQPNMAKSSEMNQNRPFSRKSDLCLVFPPLGSSRWLFWCLLNPEWKGFKVHFVLNRSFSQFSQFSPSCFSFLCFPCFVLLLFLIFVFPFLFGFLGISFTFVFFCSYQHHGWMFPLVLILWPIAGSLWIQWQCYSSLSLPYMGLLLKVSEHTCEGWYCSNCCVVVFFFFCGWTSSVTVCWHVVRYEISNTFLSGHLSILFRLK